jgi:hypothetical protein
MVKGSGSSPEMCLSPILLVRAGKGGLEKQWLWEIS